MTRAKITPGINQALREFHLLGPLPLEKMSRKAASEDPDVRKTSWDVNLQLPAPVPLLHYSCCFDIHMQCLYAVLPRVVM